MKILHFFVLVLFLAPGCSKVEDGEIVMCKHCGKELARNVQVMNVPFWDAGKHRVEIERIYCDKCGNEMVPYEVSIRCERCGEIYRHFTEMAPRSAEKRDKTITGGFCSDRCRFAEKVDTMIDEGSRKAGDILGRIGKGISEGVKEHAQ
jgi:ribosomal protein S27E